MGRIKFTGMRLTALIVFIALVCGFMFAAREFRLQSAQWHTFAVEGQTVLEDTLKLFNTDTARIYVAASNQDLYIEAPNGDAIRTQGRWGVNADLIHLGNLYTGTGDATARMRMVNTNSGTGTNYFEFLKDRGDGAWDNKSWVYPGDTLGFIRWRSMDKSEDDVFYGQMNLKVGATSSDTVENAEYGHYLFEIINNGTLRDIIEVTSSTFALNGDNQDLDFSIGKNGGTAFAINGGNGEFDFNLSDTLRYNQTDNGAGGLFVYHRKTSATPANSDIIRSDFYQMSNSSGNWTTFVSEINGTAVITDGIEDGYRRLDGMVDGTIRTYFLYDPFNNVVGYNTDGVDLDFFIEAVGIDSALYIDGTNGNTYIEEDFTVGGDILAKNVLEISDSLVYSHNKTIFLAAMDADTIFSTVAPTPTLSGVFPVFAFDPTTDNDIYLRFTLPETYIAAASVTMNIVWAPSSTNSNNVSWRSEYLAVTPSVTEQITATTDTVGRVQMSPGVAYRAMKTLDITFVTTTWLAGDIVGVRIYRDADGSDGSTDNFTGDAYFIQANIVIPLNGI